MQRTKEGDLTTAIVFYAIRCLAEGDHAALRKMKFGKKEIDELGKMDLLDLSNIGSLRSHCLDVGLNREIYWEMLRYLRSQRDAEDIKDKLIERDVPYELMRSFYGMSSREYTDRRRVLMNGSPTGPGRPVEPSNKETQRLWKHWKEVVGANETTLLSPENYIALSEKADTTLRTTWLLTERWRKEALEEISRARSVPAPKRASKASR